MSHVFTFVIQAKQCHVAIHTINAHTYLTVVTIITLIPGIYLQVSPWCCSSVSLRFVKTWA